MVGWGQLTYAWCCDHYAPVAFCKWRFSQILLTAHSSLLTPYCAFLIAHSLLLTAHSSLPATPHLLWQQGAEESRIIDDFELLHRGERRADTGHWAKARLQAKLRARKRAEAKVGVGALAFQKRLLTCNLLTCKLQHSLARRCIASHGLAHGATYPHNHTPARNTRIAQTAEVRLHSLLHTLHICKSKRPDTRASISERACGGVCKKKSPCTTFHERAGSISWSSISLAARTAEGAISMPRASRPSKKGTNQGECLPLHT